jgi:hypothetical protein
MRTVVITFLLVFWLLTGYAQGNVKFESTAGVGTFSYFVGLVKVDPGPGWKGYNLPREPGTGFLISTSNGLSIFDFFHVGIGTGYAKINKTSGLMLFADLRADFSKKKPFAMFLYINPGYSHFWNQYEGGTGTALFDIGLGTRLKVLAKSKALLSLGLLSMQQNTYVSAKLGFTF